MSAAKKSKNDKNWLARMKVDKDNLHLAVTPGASAKFPMETIRELVVRHYDGDFGKVTENNEIIKSGGGTVMSAFEGIKDKSGKSARLWVSTSIQYDKEYDVDSTTVFLPEEY